MSARILVVDDSASMRQMVAFALSSAGFSVDEAEDGQVALGRAQGQKFNAVVTDVNMPNMDGFTFIRTVREQEVYRNLPIVVLSTEGQEKDIKQGISLGANLYMVKPAQPQQMVRNIKMLLG